MIGLFMATGIESAPFIKRDFKDTVETQPFVIYKNDAMVLTITGLGKINAASAAAYTCAKYPIETLINCGAAGALNSEYSVGEIYPVHRVLDLDRPKLISKDKRFVEISSLSGTFPVVCATRDIPVTEATERALLSQSADLIDMEAAACSQVALKFKLPLYIYKIVTDTADHTKDVDIIHNVRKTREILYEYMNVEVFPSF